MQIKTEEEQLRYWLQCLNAATGYGGGTYLADRLEVGNSTISRLVRGDVKLDQKTIKVIALLQESKDELHVDQPVQWEKESGPYIFRYRSGTYDIITWEKKFTFEENSATL